MKCSRLHRRLLQATILFALMVAHNALAASSGRLDGHALYLHQCAACHGDSGHGDGPEATLFVTRPSNLRDGYLDTHPPDQVVEKILHASGHGLAVDLPTMRTRIADTESLAAYLRRLPSADWTAVDSGQALFADRCTPCHGQFGRPDAQRPPGVRPPRDLSDPSFASSTSDADMATAVRHGRAGMPALTPRLSDAEARNIAAFIRVLSPGYVTYTEYCAQCHGDHGIGTGSMAESVRAPTVIFDRAYFARRDPEEFRASIWHMLDEHQPAMPHFRGAISRAQATAIVRYLQRIPKNR
ncbi:MAG: c-type cytochrome [bacterium]